MRRSTFELTYPLFLSGEAPASEVFAEDAVLHVPGRSKVAGTFVGEHQIQGYYDSLGALSGDTLRIDLEAISEMGRYLAVWQHVKASRDGRAFDDLQCLRVLIAMAKRVSWLYPRVSWRTTISGGVGRPLLTPEGGDILARAFREAAPRAPGPLGCSRSCSR
jgi:hypothetical protein